jgi:hypothetical protein
MQSLEQVGITIRQLGGVASLVATRTLAIGVQFQYLHGEFTVTRVESRVVNKVRMTTMIAECDRTGKFLFILHKEVSESGVEYA